MPLACAHCAAALTDQAVICHPCTAGLATDLGAVPAALEALDVTLSRQARISTPAKGNGDKPLPIDMRASDAASQLRTVLHGWARCLLEEGDYTDADWTTAGRDTAGWLEDHLADVRNREWASELIRELRHAVNDADRAVDRPEPRRYVGPCGNPDSDPPCQADLWATPTAQEVTCRTCGHVWDVEQRADQLVAVARDEWLDARAAASLASLVTKTRVTASLVAILAAAGHLRRHPENAMFGGPDRYRVSSVLDALKYRHDHTPGTATEVVAWMREVYGMEVTRAAVLKWGQRHPEDVQRYDDGRYVRLTVLAVARRLVVEERTKAA